MHICKISSCDYVVPGNYNPQYGLPMSDDDDTIIGADRAEMVFRNCLVIAFKKSLYVDSQGRLEGYRWFNLPGRLILWICNQWSGGKIEADAILQIEETFEFQE